jgi:hypothetical protein
MGLFTRSLQLEPEAAPRILNFGPRSHILGHEFEFDM